MTKVSHLLRVILVCASFQAAFGQSASPTVGEDEAIRRQEKAIMLRNDLKAARAASEQKDVATAAKFYEEAWNISNDLGSAIDVEAESRESAQGLAASRFALAVAAQRAGDFREANLQIARALKADPASAQLRSFKQDNDKRLADIQNRLPSEDALNRLAQNKTNLARISTQVNDGIVLFQMGKLDEAEAIFKKALQEEPDLTVPYYYLNLIKEKRFVRADLKRMVTNKQKLVEVEQKWAQPESRMPERNPFARTNLINTSPSRQLIRSKLDRIILDEVKFESLPLSEVVKYLDEQARKRDPDKKGINFIINPSVDLPPQQNIATIDPATGQPTQGSPAEQVDLNNVAIKLSTPLRNIRLMDAIDAIAQVAEKPIKFSIEDYAVVFSQRLPAQIQLFTREFRVDPNTFIQGLESVSGIDITSQIGGGSSGGGGGGGGGGSRGGGGGSSGGSSGQGGTGGFNIPRIEVSGGTTGGVGGGGGGGGGFGGGGAGGAGGAGISYVTRTNNLMNIQILVRQFFLACGVYFPITVQAGGVGGAGGIGGGGGGFGGGAGGFGGGGFGGGGFGGGGFGGGAGGFPGAGGAGGGFDPNAIPDAKALFFNDRTGVLFVRATLSDLDIIERAIQALNVAPPLIDLEAKFAEVTQSDNKALGFNWQLGNFLMGGGKVGLSGGTAPSFTGAPSAANPAGSFPSYGSIAPSGSDQNITAGVRNVDANQTAIPTVATVTGILTDPQFRVAINAIEQREGADLITAPKLVTVSGRQAHIEISDVRTIVTGLDLNNASSNGGANSVNGGAGGGAIVTTPNYPTTAIPFGPSLDVIPYVSADGYSVQMTIIPSLIEFLGYDDPGQFIPTFNSVAGNSIGQTRTAQLPLPRLRVRQVVTSATVWDGQTVVLGGLISENVKRVRDKIPGLGDIPLLGRLFQSSGTSSEKKNLMIFVTPTIIDPAGKRVHDPNNMPYDPAATSATSSSK